MHTQTHARARTQACCALLSYATIVGVQVVPLQRISSADHLRRVATLAAVFTLSVMAGNTSLKYIPVSFNQAIGATTPAWTAGIAYAFAGTAEKRSTYLALAPVILGVVLATGECARAGSACARARACPR